jgi:dolichol-phosphate mannosyltransferase
MRPSPAPSPVERWPIDSSEVHQVMRISVLVPAYEEASTIGAVLQELVQFEASRFGVDLEIIVCDDGSEDDTAAEVRRMQRDHTSIRLVVHDENRGKGRAIRTALEYALGDYVMIHDADLEYSVGDYPAMIEAARSGALVVYGSRFRGRRYPTGMHLANFVANRLLAWAANVLFGHRITDEATCLKLFRIEVLRSLELTCERFEFCPEVTAKLGCLGIPIVEVPIGYRARDVRSGKKVRWTDGVQAIAVLLQYRLRRADLASARTVCWLPVPNPNRPTVSEVSMVAPGLESSALDS